MAYLGGMLDDSGSMQNELTRRLGAAKGHFRILAKVWKSSTLSSKRKIRIFESLVLSSLLHGLAAGCFNVAQRRQLDAFQVRCLRMILHILPAFLSRISNKDVLRRAGSPKTLSQMVLEHQLDVMGNVLRAPAHHALHNCVFAIGETPVVSYFVRRIGRPRIEWVPHVLQEARRRTALPLRELAADRRAWRRSMRTSVIA